MANDWYDIKFIESAMNVRQLIQKSTGRAPNASVAREIAICIQQGRLFFEAAAAAPIQIKPLQIYYGVVGFFTSSNSGNNRKLSLNFETRAWTHGHHAAQWKRRKIAGARGE